MGPEQLFSRLKAYIKKEWIICFCSAIVIGLAAHIYKLTNFLPNWDSLLNLYTNQDKTDLGRCFLMYACSLSSYYDLPWINGLLSLVYIACSAVCVSELFHIRKKIPLILLGGIMVTFPTVTSTLAYNYTADGYFLALLCMCVAVILIVRYQKGFFPAAVLFAFGLGVYQAYITFAVVLILIYLIDQLLFYQINIREFRIITSRSVISGILGAMIYWISLKIRLLTSEGSLSEYQNVNEAFSLQSIDIFRAILRCGYRFLIYFFDFSKGINLFLVINIGLILLLAVLFLYAFKSKNMSKTPWRLGMVIFCVAMLPFASYALYFISYLMDYHNLMVMCLCLIYILPLLFYERLSSVTKEVCLMKWGILILSLTMVYYFVMISNISYQKMHMAYEKSYGVTVRLADRIEQLPGADQCSEIAVAGCLPGSEAFSYSFPPDMTGITDSYIIRKQDTMMHENVLQAMLRDYCGISYEDTTEEEVQKIYSTEEFKKMGCWPEDNSVSVIGDILVIKFGGEIDE